MKQSQYIPLISRRSSAVSTGLFFSLFLTLSGSFAENIPAREEGAVTVRVGQSDAHDSTKVIQQAIDSGAAKVIIPKLASPWVVGPITLRSNLELVFEPGTELKAKKGAFKKPSQPLFNAVNVENLTIRGETGEAVTLRMRKEDYQSSDYEPSEHRHGIRLIDCKNVHIENITIAESGGDGIYLGGGERINGCHDVTIRNIIADSNHRQGISLISGKNILIEDCIFRNTNGTAPGSGFDFEPNQKASSKAVSQYGINIVVRNCVSENNFGGGFVNYLLKLRKDAPPVSVRYENCKVINNNRAAFVVGGVASDGPDGEIVFVNCSAENVQEPGIYVYDKDSERVKVVFENCSLKNVGAGEGGATVSPELIGRDVREAIPNAPVVLFLRRPQITAAPGGVEFRGCTVSDSADRPVVVSASLGSKDHGFMNVSGEIRADSASPFARFSDISQNISLKITKATK